MLFQALLFLNKMPKWVNHLATNKFIQQDAFFLHAQERALHKSGEYSTLKAEDEESDNYASAVVPVSSDKAVLMFRKWLQDFGGGRIPFRGELTMSPINENEVFDIYNSHTKYCTACMGALTNLRKVKLTAASMAIVMMIWNPDVLGPLGTGAVVALLSGTALLADKIAGLLVRMEYHHAEND